MSDLNIDNSDLDTNQGLDNGPWQDDNARLQAQLSASSNESKLLNEVNKVLISDDFGYFWELLSKDSKMSERVVEKIAKLKWMWTDEVRNLLLENQQASKTLTPYEIEQEVKKTLAKNEWEKALENFIKEVWIDKDKELNDEFMTTFEEYMQWKEFTLANVKKFSKSAYRDLKEDNVKLFEKKKWEIEAQIISWWNSKQTNNKAPQLLWNTNRNVDW